MIELKSKLLKSKNNTASAILVHTSSGKLARAIAAYRPNIPIIACLQGDDALKIGRQLMIHRGIHPVIIHPSKGSIDTAKEIGFIHAGDHILLLGPRENEDISRRVLAVH